MNENLERILYKTLDGMKEEQRVTWLWETRKRLTSKDCPYSEQDFERLVEKYAPDHQKNNLLGYEF